MLIVQKQEGKFVKPVLISKFQSMTSMESGMGVNPLIYTCPDLVGKKLFFLKKFKKNIRKKIFVKKSGGCLQQTYSRNIESVNSK